MANIYQHLEYRHWLRLHSNDWKKQHPGATLGKLAERARLQPPYLTNVLKERAHLNADQLHALGQVFELDSDEMEYATLLLEFERSGLALRRENLKKRIEEIRKMKMQSEKHLKKQVVDARNEEFAPFFLNPFYALLNLLLGIKRFAKDPKRVARCLNLDAHQVQTWIKDLVKLGFVGPAADGYVSLKKNFHLPKDSPLCDPHQSLLQQSIAHHLQTLPAEEKYSFNVMFTADPAVREKIHREFLQFLKTVEPLVKDAPAEELYGMRFDLFRWSYEKGS